MDLPEHLLVEVLRLVAQKSKKDWALALLACKALHSAGQAVGLLPLIGVSERGLPSLCKTAVHRRRQRRCGDMHRPEGGSGGKLCHRLVVQPLGLRTSGHQLCGLLGALSREAAPEELVLKWLSGLQPRMVHLLHQALGQMAGLRRLEVQLRQKFGTVTFFSSMMRELRNLQELRLVFDSPAPSAELHMAELPALTRLSLTHAHPPSQMPEPTSSAVLDPRLLPALELLELRSWHAVAVTGIGAEAAGGRMPVPRISVCGPCIHQHYASLAPMALSLNRVLQVPVIDCALLTSLQLNMVEILGHLLGPLPPMPRLASLEVGQGVGREGQVEALAASNPQLVQVRRREGGLPFPQFCASRRISHWQAMQEGPLA